MTLDQAEFQPPEGDPWVGLLEMHDFLRLLIPPTSIGVLDPLKIAQDQLSEAGSPPEIETKVYRSGLFRYLTEVYPLLLDRFHYPHEARVYQLLSGLEYLDSKRLKVFNAHQQAYVNYLTLAEYSALTKQEAITLASLTAWVTTTKPDLKAENPARTISGRTVDCAMAFSVLLIPNGQEREQMAAKIAQVWTSDLLGSSQ